MTCRLLPHNEWDRLRAPVKQLFGDDKEPPAPEIAPFCAVEENDNGEIIGFLFLQLAFHLEPFGSMGGVSFGELRGIIDEALTGIPDVVYYLYSDNPIGVGIFETHGFTQKGTLLEGKPRG